LHLDTKEKPYVCDCGAAFARRDLLHRHERLAHAGASDVCTQNIRTLSLVTDRDTSTAGPTQSPNLQGQSQVNALVSNERVEAHAEQDLVVEADAAIDSAHDPALPIPPEYHHLGQHFQGHKALPLP
jgi:hypothetical protein